VTILLAAAIAQLRVAGTYPSTLVEVEAPLTGAASPWIVAFVVAMAALTAWTARRYLDRARRRAGAAGIAPFVAAGTDPGGTSDAPAIAARGGRQDVGPDRPLAIRPMRRTVVAAVTIAVLGLVALAAGQAVLVLADGPAAIRTGSWLAIAGSLGVVAAAALLPVVFRGTDRRLAEASRDADGGPVVDPGPRSAVVAPLLAIAIVGSSALAIGISAANAEPPVCDVGPGFSCGIVRVPADRDAPSSGVLEMAYTIHAATAPAPGAPRRVLVLAVGGPGIAGLPEAGWMYDSLDDRVRERLDVVVYDPRATGQSEFHDCPGAADEYYAGTGVPSASAARTFARSCIAESGTEAQDLSRFGTREVAEDIDALRDVLGVDRISLYGVSYGTVVAQAYAAAHPDRLDALVLDAPVDRTLPPAESWALSAVGFETALRDTFTACRSDSSCRDDLHDPGRAWARLLESTADEPLAAELFDGDGVPYPVTVSRGDLLNIMQGAMYDTTDRMSFLRALAAYDGGDPRGFARLWEAWSGESEDSSFAYFATWCADARHSPTATADDYDAYLDVAERAGLHDAASLSVAYATAPCVFWPAQPARWEQPAEASSVPTLILAATSDPITPVSEARGILARHPEARLVETRGGAHGSLGDVCPMERMTRFLVEGTLPESRTTTCQGSIIDVYVPLAPSPAATADDAVSGLYWELFGDPRVLDWSGDEPLSIGCLGGGTVAIDPADVDWRAVVRLDRCSVAPGAELSGGGTIDLAGWGAVLDLTSPRGRVRLDGSPDDWHVTGTWDGTPVSVDE
jgi:pimeloyl-ACP methyl ester carboxylesterase